MTHKWKEYPKSRQMYEDAKRVFAMGVGSQVQSFSRPHPLYMTHGKGSKLYDVDGNEFIDYLLNYGPLILGHSPKVLNDAVRAQLDKGTAFGEPHPLQIEAARLLVEAVPSFEVVNFNNTGSEAVQAVLRLARAVTGRTKFIKFEGHYHGWIDNVFFSFHPDQGEDFGTRENPKPVIHNYSKGITPNVLDNAVALPWNSLESVEKAFRTHKGEIAAILTEPIMSNCGIIMPRPGYLEGLRKLATANGAMLIFDETITGMRGALGGAQEIFGVIPDITCGFKALGGGFPIFVYGASAEIMQVVSNRQAVHAGTFNANAVGCAAAIAVIKELRKDNCGIIRRINEVGKHMMSTIAAMAKKHGITVRIQGPGSVFCVSFHGHEIWDMRDAFDESNDKYFVFRQLLLDNGIHIFPTEKGLWYLSAAHTDEDVQKTLSIVDRVFATMKGMGL
ncbi:MAG TPA: aspartate aminotransferase family protein [Terriglobales bacterium]|nr:aspartate aminotransferase family protein [Terriglobales bacterium]